MQQNQHGFTLIELLLVIVIIAILAVVVFAALNPVKRIKDAQDARRATDIETILTAVHEYVIDNKGSLPSGMGVALPEVQLGTDTSGCEISIGGCLASGSSCLDLSSPLAKYIKSIPYDPAYGTSGKTYYTIAVDSNAIVTVKACGVTTGTLSQSR